MTLGPWGVGHLDGRAIMVAKAAPGDHLDVTTLTERRDYRIAQIERILRAGPSRRETPCQYAPRCGGCDWQHIAYAAQIEFKAELIAAELGRALGIKILPEGLVEPSPDEFAYRSRVRFQVGPRGEVGFYEASGKRLVEVNRCMVAVDSIRVPKEIAGALAGQCSEIEVVDNGSGGQVLVINLGAKPAPGDVKAVERVMAADPSIHGAILRSAGARRPIGNAEIATELEPGLTVEADADLFSQVNRPLNYRMTEYVMTLAEPGPDRAILDLFCGSGNFSLPAARRGALVTGVDSVGEAIEAARRNAGRLGLGKTTQFIAMKATDTAKFLSRAMYRADVLILDPPRAGARELIAPLMKLRPPRIVYVSCNVATLARDLAAMARGGYVPKRLRAFDFFPNTHHAEVIAEMLLT